MHEYKFGELVSISPKYTGKHKRFVGMTGQIGNTRPGVVGVCFEGWVNQDSTDGLYWFREDKLTPRHYAGLESSASSYKKPVPSIYYNEKKGTTVFKDSYGVVTKVKVQDGDTFDLEKGVLLCLVKYYSKLGGSFNKLVHQLTESATETK